MMFSCCYSCGFQIPACKDFNKVIDDPICSAVDNFFVEGVQYTSC